MLHAVSYTHLYMDGGGVNNVPVDVLLDRGYRDIIIIRIYGWGFDKERVVKVPEDDNVYHIAPRQGLGGILEFDARQSRKNMTMGYYDGLRFLYGLDVYKRQGQDLQQCVHHDAEAGCVPSGSGY